MSRGFHYFGPYGEPAVRVFFSAPKFLSETVAQIGMGFMSGGGLDQGICRFEKVDSEWTLPEECDLIRIRA